MSQNEVFRVGNKVSLPVPANTVAGTPLRIGGLNAITATDRAKTDVVPTNANGTVNTAYNYGGGNVTGNASCWLDGAHSVTVGFAAAIGDEIYITVADNSLSTTSSGNKLYGHALSAKGATSGPLTVRIAN